MSAEDITLPPSRRPPVSKRGKRLQDEVNEESTGDEVVVPLPKVPRSPIKNPGTETLIAESSSRKGKRVTQRNGQLDYDAFDEELTEGEDASLSDESVGYTQPPKRRVQTRRNAVMDDDNEVTASKKRRVKGHDGPGPSTYVFQGSQGNEVNNDFDFKIGGATPFDAFWSEPGMHKEGRKEHRRQSRRPGSPRNPHQQKTAPKGLDWGQRSAQLRLEFPMVEPFPDSRSDYNHRELRRDPDGMSSGPITGRICYIVVRGYLFVVMPSRISMERFSCQQCRDNAQWNKGDSAR